MLCLTFAFLVTAWIGAALGLLDFDGTALEGARILFFACILLSALSLFMVRRAASKFRSECRPPTVSSLPSRRASHGPAPRRVRAVTFDLPTRNGNPTSKMARPGVKEARPSRGPAPRGSSAEFLARLGMRYASDGARPQVHSPGDLCKTLRDPRRCMT